MSAAIVWKIDPFASEQSDQSAQSGLKRGRGFNNVTEVLLSTKMGQFFPLLLRCTATEIYCISFHFVSCIRSRSPMCAHMQSCVRASIIALPIVMRKAFLLNSGFPEKIFIDVNKCFNTESTKRKIFCKLKSACSLLWTFPPTFNEGISFFREKLNVQKLYFLEYFISFNSSAANSVRYCKVNWSSK